MATYFRVHDLLNGFPTAVSGTASFYLPNTTTLIPVYGDTSGTAITNPVALNSNGAALVYLSQLARMIVQDSTGLTIRDVVINGDADATVTNTSAAFSGATQKAVNDSALTAFGGQDFQYVPSGAWVGMTPKAWMNGVVRNVMAYGSVGATSVNDGVTPADTAIAAAIADCAAAGGGVVFFPPGTYLINSTITNGTSGVSFQGAGTGSTTIKNNSTTNNAFTITAAGGFFVKDMLVTATAASTGYAFSLGTSGSVVLFQGVRTALHDVAVSLSGQTSVSVTNCYLVVNDVAASRCIAAAGVAGLTVLGTYMYGGSNGASRCVALTGTTATTEFTGNYFDTAGVTLNTTGTGHKFVGNKTNVSPLFTISTAGFPQGFYQAGNGNDGYTEDRTSAQAYTPDLTYGYDLRVRITTDTGAAHVINAPAKLPHTSDRNLLVTLTVVNVAAPTSWTIDAIFHLSAVPSTTINEITTYLLRWDGDASVFRQIARTVTT